MKYLLPRTMLLATLSVVSTTSNGQTPPVDPKSGESVQAFALQWFERLQAGQIDRNQMTTALSETLTDDSVKEMARIVTSFGPATKDEIVGNRKIGDQVFYVVKLFLVRGDALSLLIGFSENGKITGVTFPSLGQE